MDEEWENNEGTTPAGGAILNRELCFAYSEGYKRWEEYFRKFLVEGNLNDATRTETDRGVNLKLLDSTLSEKADREKRDLKRAVSTDFDYLNTKGIYILEELRKEVRKLNESLSRGAKVKVSSFKGPDDKSAQKKHYIQAIIQARKRLMAKDASWKQSQEQALRHKQRQERASESAEFQARVNAELDLKFFGFNECSAWDTYSTEYRVHGNEQDMLPAECGRQASAHGKTSVTTSGALSNTPDLDRFKVGN